ncbi:hypothetical protein Tco_0396321 [Tanacetum coccineum]
MASGCCMTTATCVFSCRGIKEEDDKESVFMLDCGFQTSQCRRWSGRRLLAHAPCTYVLYSRQCDEGNVLQSCLLAISLVGDRTPNAEGRTSRARLSGGHFIRRLAMHFGLGPKRQQAATAGAHEVDKAGLAAEEGAQEIPAPAQAPPPPPPAPQPQTMSQRIERIEEEVHDLRRDVVGLRGVA